MQQTKYVSVDTLVKEAFAKRKQDGANSRVILILEGPTDRHIYRWQVDESKCHILIGEGKQNVIESQAVLEAKGFKGALSIVDLDFDLLNGISSSSPNILRTDTHDLETMILKTIALEKILEVFGSDEKINQLRIKGRDIRSLLLAAVVPLGYLRWISQKEGLSLDFQDLSYEKFIDKNTLLVDIKSMIRQVQSHTIGKPRLTDQQLAERIAELSGQMHDPWQVGTGHDLIAVLTLGLRKAIGTSKISEAELMERCTYLAYEHAFFSQTQLYLAIREWELRNGLMVLHSSL